MPETTEVSMQMKQEAQDSAIPPGPEPIDLLKEEINDLQRQIVQGMPTGTEMLKGEPRTISRHITWEKLNRVRIARYLQLRLQNPSLPSVEALRIP